MHFILILFKKYIKMYLKIVLHFVPPKMHIKIQKYNITLTGVILLPNEYFYFDTDANTSVLLIQ